jgi:uncharacterized membrane protein YciS (DUF1049 family)
MKLYHLLVSEHINANILYLIVTLANIDYVGVIDYALKAILGSAVWFGFRVMGDYYTQKIKRSANQTKNGQTKKDGNK